MKDAQLPTLLSMNLAKHLRQMMKAKGMTAAELARKASVPKQSVSDWLGGSNPRDLRALKRVADELGVSIDRICFGDVDLVKEARITSVDDFLGDEWVSGLFEIRFRRIKK